MKHNNNKNNPGCLENFTGSIKPKILIVEDHFPTLKTCAAFLEKNNMNVSVCTTGAAAISIIKTGKYDLIIMDNRLPDMTSIDIINSIQDFALCPPIMLWSGTCTTDEKIKAWNSGMVIDIIQKPTASGVLLVQIRVRLSESRGLLMKRYETMVGALLLDLKKNVVSFYGRDMDLSPKEFSLLTYLVKHADSVIEKNLIMNFVYREDIRADGLPNPKIMDVVVCKLRIKIAQYDPFRPYIKTIWARGYMVQKEPEIYIWSIIFIIFMISMISVVINVITFSVLTIVENISLDKQYNIWLKDCIVIESDDNKDYGIVE